MNRVYEYVDMVQAKLDFHWEVNEYKFAPAPEVTAEFGRRYAKIIKTDREWKEEAVFDKLRGINRFLQKTVHSFVDMRNGDILKSASWKAPAPNGVRGNIFEHDIGADVVNEHGCNYLKGPKL